MDRLFWHLGQQAGWSPQQPGTVSLPRTGAHVWFFGNALNDEYEQIVSAAERARAEDMLPKEKAKEFLGYRACLRVLLALHYVKNLPPREIRIEISDHGKPWLPDQPSVRFNLSHSYGALAIAVSRLEVGIDIEKIRPVPDWRELAQNLLTPSETARIAQLHEAERSRAFLRCFTAREAYVKATGTGFSVPLPAIHFTASDSEIPGPNGQSAQLAPLPQLRDFVGHACLVQPG